MPALQQYDYIFVICLFAAALDAFNIGANDVANTFGPAVSSRSLTLRQAVVLASITEFTGAVLAGARVAGTIRYGIVQLSAFNENAGVQMLAMTTALVASAGWLMFCTYFKWPVSTTYSIVSAMAGMGIALAGPSAPNWGWNGGSGLATIFAGFGIAPAISGVVASIVYLIVKFAVLTRKDSFRAGLIVAPFFFFFVSAFLAMTIIFGGAPSLGLEDLSGVTTALAIILTGVVIGILSIIFWVPYVYCKVQRKDYTIRWYHFFFGPLLWRRPAPAESLDEIVANVPDYRITGREAAEPVVDEKGNGAGDAEAVAAVPTKIIDGEEYVLKSALAPTEPAPLAEVEKDMSREIVGPWILPRNLWVVLRYKVPKVLLHGSSVDVHEMQAGKKGTAHSERIATMHAQATQYPNETEHLFSLMQVLTSCVASFSHGANDVSNAIGPFASVFFVWQNGIVTPANTPTPIWILAFGGIWICIGLATMGYRVMSVLGNRLTLHSPSRSFAISLGAAVTSLLAAQLGIPASTTMCIVGATAGVGITSGGWRALNYRGFAWIVMGWVLTVPVAGTLSGVLLALFINAPRP